MIVFLSHLHDILVRFDKGSLHGYQYYVDHEETRRHEGANRRLVRQHCLQPESRRISVQSQRSSIQLVSTWFLSSLRKLEHQIHSCLKTEEEIGNEVGEAAEPPEAKAHVTEQESVSVKTWRAREIVSESGAGKKRWGAFDTIQPLVHLRFYLEVHDSMSPLTPLPSHLCPK